MRILKKRTKIRTPIALEKELLKIGERYSRNNVITAYLLITATAVAMGMLFQLPWEMIVVCSVFYILMTPKLLYNYKKQGYEKRRFDDLNAYLSQMNQSFTSTKNVLHSLRETESTFTEGKMKRTIRLAIEMIERSSTDYRKTEIEALSSIEKEYSCEKIRNLHDFLIRAEARGGDCSSEFKILYKINTVWKTTILGYYTKMKGFRNIVALYYVLLLAVCVYLLRNFPDMINLIGHGLVRVTNMIEIILFIVVFTYTDSKLNGSLLRDIKYMEKASAISANEYLIYYDDKKERKKYIPLILFSVLLSISLFILKPNGLMVILCILVVAFVFHLHKIIYYLNWLSVRTEITKAFPKWLFDVLLLMQTESVEASIFQSREYAPPILWSELDRICTELDKQPGNPNTYMSFLSEYRIEGVEDAMRKLYSLAVGTGNKEVMTTVIEQSLTLLEEAEEKNIKNRGDLKTIYQYIPIAFMTLGMIAYLVALVLEVFQKINTIMSF